MTVFQDDATRYSLLWLNTCIYYKNSATSSFAVHVDADHYYDRLQMYHCGYCFIISIFIKPIIENKQKHGL